MPRTSVTVGFYHRDFYNLQVSDNQNLSTADWTALSVATPTDPRLPLSGQPIPLYTLNPAKVGIATDNLLYVFDAEQVGLQRLRGDRAISAATSSSSSAA